MVLGGGLLAAVMLVVLYQLFSSVSDGSTPTVLAEAVTPWNIFASLGLLIFLAGLIAWIVGWFLGRGDKRKEQLKNNEKRVNAVDERTNLA